MYSFFLGVYAMLFEISFIPFVSRFKISLIYDGTIQFEHLKTVFAMQGSDLWKTGNQFVFRISIAPSVSVRL